MFGEFEHISFSRLSLMKEAERKKEILQSLTISEHLSSAWSKIKETCRVQ